MNLEKCRKEIDEIDAEILLLLGKRAEVARRIGIVKAGSGLPIVDREREDEVLHGISGEFKDALPYQAAVRIFRRIIRESRLIQQDGLSEYIREAEKISR